ncbi:MAG: hypothetical protein ABSG52_16235 [Terriglobales bacterium]
MNLAVEDAVSEAVVRRLLDIVNRDYAARTIYNRGGFGYLKKNIIGFNNAAKGTPFLVLTDLDASPCPSALIANWLPHPKRHNLLLRVAVKEVEAWLLADRYGISKYLGIRTEEVPANPESLADAKKSLVQLACKSPRKEIKRDICPPAGSTRQVGPNYTGQLTLFIVRYWDPNAAKINALSLDRTINRLMAFQPTWQQN